MAKKASIPIRSQTSAGGVAFRKKDGEIYVALIAVGAENRWQLPKGIIDKNEARSDAAQREVREEAGISTELISLIDKVEYWYVATEKNERVRFHKFVYFYLMRYVSGDVRDHDAEVNEARWVKIAEAEDMLAFRSEKEIMRQAKEMLVELE